MGRTDLCLFRPPHRASLVKKTLTEHGIITMKTRGAGGEILHAIVFQTPPAETLVKTLREAAQEFNVTLLKRTELCVNKDEEIITIHSTLKNVNASKILNSDYHKIAPLNLKLLIPTGQRILAIRSTVNPPPPPQSQFWRTPTSLFLTTRAAFFTNLVATSPHLQPPAKSTNPVYTS